MTTVGDRVSLRYRTADGLTDVIGELETVTPLIAIRTKSGETVQISPGDVVAVRELSHVTVRNSDIRGLEHAAALAWPGTEQQWMDGWLLRAGSGQTSRANSAVPLLIESNIRALLDISAWYAERGLAPWLALPERLLPIKTAGLKPTRVLVRDVPPVISPDAALSSSPDADWLRIYRRDVSADVLTAIDGEVTFARTGSGVGRGAVTVAPDGTRWLGISCVRVADGARRSGHARAVCAALQAWGASRGATRSYVQVLADNQPAATLYSSLGYRLHHMARYIDADSLLPHA